MKLFGTVVCGKGEVVATTISGREFGVHSAQGMKRLMDVSMIMDEQPEGIRAAMGIVILVCLHDSLVHIRILIARLVQEPVNNTWNGNCDVLHVLLEFGIVFIVSTLVKVRNINEVPVRLPASTTELNDVSESSAFHKSMIAFIVGQRLVRHYFEHFLSSLQSRWILLLEDIISHAGHYTAQDMRYQKSYEKILYSVFFGSAQCLGGWYLPR